MSWLQAQALELDSLLHTQVHHQLAKTLYSHSAPLCFRILACDKGDPHTYLGHVGWLGRPREAELAKQWEQFLASPREE